MSIVIPSLRAAVAVPGWAKNVLWRNARAVPSLDLRFADNKSLTDAITGASLVTFTRASSGTFVDSAGVLQTAAIDVPRFDHNPTTGESLGLLVEEQRTNLLTRSEEFGTTWSALNSSIFANTTVAPDGTLTADKIIENSITNVHGVSRGFASESLANGTVYTFSVYAKAAERGFVWMQALNSFAKSYFNLSTGVVSASGAGHTSTITPVGNGWYRCAITFTSDQTNNSYRAIGMAQVSGTESYTGDNTSGLFLWGAQLEAGAFATSYIPTLPTFVSRASSATFYDSTGIVQTAASGVARSNAFLPDSTGVFRSVGLLLEEARTNLLLRSEEFDNASWTPTGLQAFGSGSVANAIASPSSSITADLITENTANSEHNVLQAITVASSTVYTLSCFAKKGTRSILAMSPTSPGVANYYTLFNLDTGAIAFNETGNTSTITALGNGWYRCSITRVTGAAQVFSNNKIGIANNALSSTYTGDGISGIYIWGAQLEAGAFPTSYILTTTAAATRAADVSTSAAATRSADVASITGSNFSSWYRQDEGTFYGEATGLSGGATITVRASADAGERIQFNNGLGQTAVIASGAAQAIFGSPGTNKQAFAFKANDFAQKRVGFALETDSSGTLPVVNMATIGKFDFGGQDSLNGRIRRLVFWPVRLPDTTLETLTQ